MIRESTRTVSRASPVSLHQSPISRLASSVTLLLALLAGCAVAPRQPAATGPEAQCYEVFLRVDRAVAEAGVQDGMAARVAGFPYLRASRFLASYTQN